LGEIMLGRIRRVHDYDVEAELLTTPENRIN